MKTYKVETDQGPICLCSPTELTIAMATEYLQAEPAFKFNVITGIQLVSEIEMRVVTITDIDGHTDYQIVAGTEVEVRNQFESLVEWYSELDLTYIVTMPDIDTRPDRYYRLFDANIRQTWMEADYREITEYALTMHYTQFVEVTKADAQARYNQLIAMPFIKHSPELWDELISLVSLV